MLTSVLTMACSEPIDALDEGGDRRRSRRPGSSSPETSHSDAMMTSEPTRSDSTIAMSGSGQDPPSARSQPRVSCGASRRSPARRPRARRPPVAISRPTSFLSAVRPSRIATISPRYMTAIRSDSSRISSSSADTSRIAVPASRLAIAWRWMNSMLPTSRPRVGWSRTSRRRSRSNSRATTTFCWLPPDSVPAFDVGRRRADVEAP